MMVFPVLALIVAASMATGGMDAVLLTLDSAIRHIVSAVVNLARSF
jgi:hypothetical protein